MRRSLVIFFVFSAFILSACASDGSLTNPFAESAPAPTSPYYFDEFVDVPIPHDMREISEESMITYAPSGVKIGIQRFKGRVDANSLINTMRKNMTSQGWTLHSLFRAQHSIIIYEKPDRVCTLYVSDDTIYTNMRVFVSPKLSGDIAKFDSPVVEASPVYDSGANPAYNQGSQPLSGNHE